MLNINFAQSSFTQDDSLQAGVVLDAVTDEIIHNTNLKVGANFFEDFAKKFLFLIDLKDKL